MKEDYPVLQTLTHTGKRERPPKKQPQQDRPEPPERYSESWSKEEPGAVLGVSR